MNQFTRTQVSKNFFLDEFIPPALYQKALPSLGKDYFNQHILTAVQYLRDEINMPIYGNNWYQLVVAIMKKNGFTTWPSLANVEAFCIKYGKGNDLYDERCVRDPKTSTGAPKSRHKFELNLSGKIIRLTDAIDIQIGTMSGKQMFDLITSNKTYLETLYNLGFRRFEDPSITPGWFHMDGKDHKKGKGFQVINRTDETMFIKL